MSLVAWLCLVPAGAPATAARAAQWSIATSPNVGPQSNALSGLACSSATACKAVGFAYNSTSLARSLIESWNGTSWSINSSPNGGPADNYLTAVSCTSAWSCRAVGFYTIAGGVTRTLIESWNGTTWVITPSPNNGTQNNRLDGISCVSATSCVAVGQALLGSPSVGSTLIESWNGSTWSISTSPNSGTQDNRLMGVSCVPTGSCTAVGSFLGPGSEQTLVETLSGGAWSIVPSPNNGAFDDLLAVGCPSASSCTAVGFSLGATAAQTLVEAWNGSAWAIIPSPNSGSYDNELNAVSCATATACHAVGYAAGISGGSYRTLIEFWNGQTWSITSSPSTGSGNNVLNGTSCLATIACKAAGTYLSATHPPISRTLVESYG
jgi:hypothetical protein